MKKSYEKPAMRVVLIQHQNPLLQSSPKQSKFVDDDDYDNWDSDGAQ